MAPRAGGAIPGCQLRAIFENKNRAFDVEGPSIFLFDALALRAQLLSLAGKLLSLKIPRVCRFFPLRSKWRYGIFMPDYQPMVFTLRLDPEDAAMLRAVMRARKSASPQRAVLGVLKEAQSRASMALTSVDEPTYRRLYFELAEESLEVRRQARKFMRALDRAKNYVKAVNPKRGKKRAKSPENVVDIKWMTAEPRVDS